MTAKQPTTTPLIDGLRHRWMLELSVLRRLAAPSKEQSGRIEHLQMFLAQVDPLRSLEFNWRDRPEAQQLLLSEIKTQSTSVCDKDYRRVLFCKVIGALAGAALPAVGAACENEQAAQTICNLHGEDWPVVRAQMVARQLLRSARDGKLSMSTVGANFLDDFPATTFKDELGASAASIAARMGDDALSQVALMHFALKGNLGVGVGDRLYPASHEASSGRTATQPRPRATPLPVIPKADRQSLDADDVRRRLQSQSPAGVINQRVQGKRLQKVTWALKAVREHPYTIWQSTVGNATFGTFVGYGLTQKSASRCAAQAFCAVLMQDNTFVHWDFICALMSSPDGEPDWPAYAPGDRCRILIELNVIARETSCRMLASQPASWEASLTMVRPCLLTVAAVGQTADRANRNAICELEKALAANAEKRRSARSSPGST